MEQVKISADVKYNPSYPPKGAKKAYVAQILGTKPGPLKFDREFLGDSCYVAADAQGIYERQIGEKKGGYTRYYHVALHHPEHGMMLSYGLGEAAATKVAKLLDKGFSIDEAVAISGIRPSSKVEGQMTFDYEPRRVPEALAFCKTKDAAQDGLGTTDPVDQCIAAYRKILANVDLDKRDDIIDQLIQELGTLYLER